MHTKELQHTTLITIILLCTNAIDYILALQCFSCSATSETITSEINEKHFTESCSNFDGSSKFVIDCPYSTMCARIISTMYLQNDYEQRTMTLGCAKQKSLKHVLIKSKWKETISVEEVYPESCDIISDNNLVGTTKTYCYCRGSLCNAATQSIISIKAFIFLQFLFIINIILI